VEQERSAKLWETQERQNGPLVQVLKQACSRNKAEEKRDLWEAKDVEDFGNRTTISLKSNVGEVKSITRVPLGAEVTSNEFNKYEEERMRRAGAKEDALLRRFCDGNDAAWRPDTFFTETCGTGDVPPWPIRPSELFTNPSILMRIAAERLEKKKAKKLAKKMSKVEKKRAKKAKKDAKKAAKKLKKSKATVAPDENGAEELDQESTTEEAPQKRKTALRKADEEKHEAGTSKAVTAPVSREDEDEDEEEEGENEDEDEVSVESAAESVELPADTEDDEIEVEDGVDSEDDQEDHENEEEDDVRRGMKVKLESEEEQSAEAGDVPPQKNNKKRSKKDKKDRKDKKSKKDKKQKVEKSMKIEKRHKKQERAKDSRKKRKVSSSASSSSRSV